MRDTPFFPAWAYRLNPMGSRTAKALRTISAYTLCQLESSLGSWLPDNLFPKAHACQNSRDRCYTRWRTFWCMLWQSLNPRASGREVVRQLQALFDLHNGPQLSPQDGAYCRAKARLPAGEFPTALEATARPADQLAPALALLQGRPIKVVDGSALTLSDTPKNRAAYPPVRAGSTPTFPQVRLVVLFSLLSGAILAVAHGALGISELALLHGLAAQLKSSDIVVGDREFGCFPVIAWLRSLGVDFLGRSTRRTDGRRRLRRLGRNDWLVQWKKTPSCSSPWLGALERAALPAEMILRAVKGSCYHKGFRVRQATVLTSRLTCAVGGWKCAWTTSRRPWRWNSCAAAPQ